MGLPKNVFYRAIENFHEAFGIFLVRVAAHGRFIHGDLFTSCGDQGFQFRADNRDQRLRPRLRTRAAMPRQLQRVRRRPDSNPSSCRPERQLK